MRERIAQHRANPVCASCHAMMDPLGLSLENFDFVGTMAHRRRGADPDRRVGSAAGRHEVRRPGRAADMSCSSQPDRFVRTLTEKMLTYALGRGLEYYDMPAVRKNHARRGAQRTTGRRRSILGVVNSLPFQMRRRQS